MSWLRRPLRKIASLVLMALIFVAVVIAMFRFAAVTRETASAESAAPAGAKFATVDGRKMHYMEWGPETGRTLLLVHGTLAWSATFRDIAEPLAALGYHVVAPDLPPFGYSERPAGHDYSRAGQAKRILAFADAVGLRRFVLGVHSFGGGAAMEAAFTAPERIEAMVLLDVALGTSAGGPPMGWLLGIDAVRDTIVSSTFTNPLMTGIGLRQFIADDSIVTKERIDLYRQPLVMRGTTEAVGRWLLTGLLGDETRSLAADPARHRAFQAPVLVIWGRQDTVTPLAQGEDIVGGLPKATLEVLDGVNHIPHVEKPAEVVRLVDAFLKTLPPLAADAGASSDKQDRLPRAEPAPAAAPAATPVLTPTAPTPSP